MCRIPTQTYCKILLSMCMAMCMCISCNIYVALGARGLINISIFALSVDKQAHWLQILFPTVLNTRSQAAGIANR